MVLNCYQPYRIFLMTHVTDEHIQEAFSAACEASQEGNLQDLDTVARNLELHDDGILEALRAALDYILVVGSQREGWGIFHPLWEMGGKVYPAPLSHISPSWFPIWVRAFACAPYAYIQARFADLLWEAEFDDKQRYLWGQRAIDAYLQALDEPFGEDVYLAEGAHRALSLAKHLRDKKRQSAATTALHDLARTDLDDGEYVPGVTIPSLAALASLPRADRPGDLSDLIDAALQGEQPLHIRIECLELKRMLAETQEEDRSRRQDQVDAYADEARGSTGLARFHHFMSAIQLAEKHGLGGLAEELQQEAGPLSDESLQRVETKVEIPASEMEAYIGAFVGDDNLVNALQRFGSQIPSGDPTQNKALAQELMNTFVFRSFVTNLVTGSRGELVKKLTTPEDREEYEVVSLEAQGIRIFAGIAVEILKAIQRRYGPIGDDSSVFESDMIDDTQAEWVALAVQHYEAGDYRSSVSVMAPRLETAIRGVAQRIGVAILRDSRGGQQTGGVKPLGRLLSDLKGLMPEAARRYWKTLLVDPLGGVNLRNKVGHGLKDHPTPQDAAILIHAACQLLTLHIKEPSEG